MRVSSCNWVRARLPLHAGGELTGLDRRLVERHLVGCAACRRHLEGLSGAVAVLQAAGIEDPAAPARPIWPDLERLIRESRRPLDEAEGSWLHRLGTPLAGLAAALMLSASVGLLAVRWERAARRAETIRTVSSQGDVKKVRKATIVRPAPARPPARPVGAEAALRAEADPPRGRSVGLSQ